MQNFLFLPEKPIKTEKIKCGMSYDTENRFRSFSLLVRVSMFALPIIKASGITIQPIRKILDRLLCSAVQGEVGSNSESERCIASCSE